LSVIYFYTGRCYQLMGYPSNGARYFRQALDNGLKLNDTYLLTARCLTQNGSFDEALEYYNILAERDAYFDFIYTDMGIAYLKKGDGEKAFECFTRAVDEGRNYAFALGGCSLACLQMKNLDDSRKYYKRALMCNMDDINGFKIFYCNIAESVGLLDEIDPNMKIRAGRVGEAEDLIR
ncbi:MAG: tetratricopeptide repeat protein, partial [Oscillospiraceae bacterium]|nr:tetratricopeptide repeat protein [Oscillospiraceae bacterium]